jgi:hypothetical protein
MVSMALWASMLPGRVACIAWWVARVVGRVATIIGVTIVPCSIAFVTCRAATRQSSAQKLLARWALPDSNRELKVLPSQVEPSHLLYRFSVTPHGGS